MKIAAPAKINLRLEVLGQLGNGYHLLRMFNLTVSLTDELEIKLIPKGIEIETDDQSLPAGAGNTVYRAAAYLQKKFAREFGVRVRIQKRIPAGAGLGGGSSDAAAALRWLMAELGLDPARLDLEELAYEVGADVPYLLKGGPAWVEGIGERIEPVLGFPAMHYLLVKPGLGSSTREVYQALGPRPDLTITPKAAILGAFTGGNWKDFCVNQLEPVVFSRHRSLEKLKSELIRLGAAAAVMSGSGSSLVGIFSTREQAEKGEREILKLQPELWVRAVEECQPGAARK